MLVKEAKLSFGGGVNVVQGNVFFPYKTLLGFCFLLSVVCVFVCVCVCTIRKLLLTGDKTHFTIFPSLLSSLFLSSPHLLSPLLPTPLLSPHPMHRLILHCICVCVCVHVCVCDYVFVCVCV